MTGAIDPLLASLGPLAVLLVMGVVFAETGLLAGFFLPGDSLLFTAGLLVAHGSIGVPIWTVIPLVCVAAVAGDQVGYAVGRRYGPRVLARPSSRLLNPAHLERASTFFDRHGPRAVVLARFVPVARTFTPVAAGAGRMPYGRYLAYNIGGAVLWCTSMLLAGYLLGGVPVLRDHIELVTLGIVVASLVPAAAAVLPRRWVSAAAVALSTLGVLVLADAAREHDGPAAYDPSLAADVVSHRTGLLTRLAEVATFVGSEVCVALLAATVLVLLALRGRFREGAVLGVGMAGAAALVLGVKHVVDRARPGADVRLGAADASPSFPSGHTLMSAAFLGLVVWLVWPHLRTTAARVATVAGAVFTALAVGASRVYLGYHWTTDVVAAWLVAAAWVGTLLLAVSRRVRPRVAEPAAT